MKFYLLHFFIISMELYVVQVNERKNTKKKRMLRLNEYLPCEVITIDFVVY